MGDHCLAYDPARPAPTPEAVRAMTKLGVPDNLPEDVAKIIDGKMTDWQVDLEKYRKEGRAATRWLLDAVKSAHLHPGIKKTARNLAAVRLYTGNLETYKINDDDTGGLVFTHFRKELRAHLTSLGQSLRDIYVDQGLGAFFSKAAIDDTLLFPNPEFAHLTEITQGSVMPAVAGLFDFSDAAPIADMNEDRYLHALMMLARLADREFHERVLRVASRFGMSREDRSFQASAAKSFARCHGKMASKDDHRYKSR